MPPFRPSPRARRCAAVILALAAAPPVRAHPQAIGADTAARDDTVPVVLTISGGISLGSYQSGVNWALVDFFRHTRHDPAFRARYGVPPHRLMVATGASAGNVNAVLSALDWCAEYRPGAPAAEEGLFWRIWTGMGIGELFPNDAEGRRPPRPEQRPGETFGIFRRGTIRGLYEGPLGERFAVPRNAGCEVAVGITLTKVAADSISLNPRIHPRAQRFASIFTVRAEPGGGRLALAAAPGRMRSDPEIGKVIVAPTRADGSIPLDGVVGLVEASSAFPLAFPPVRVRYYEPAALGKGGACPAAPGGGCARPDTATFIDGGVFDNNPLGLALRLFGHLRAPGADSVRYIYIDPDGVRSDSARGAADSAPAPPGGDGRGLGAVMALLGGAVPAARQYELHSLARALPSSTRQRISVTDRRHPLVSSHLGAFAGFLGLPFREFDFYVGVYDGLYYAAHDVVCERYAADPAQQRACAGRRLGELLGDPRFRLSDPARTVLGRLFYEEFPAESGPAPRQPAEPRLTRVLLSIDEALDSAPRTPPHCAAGSPVGQALCRDGFPAFVGRLSTPRFRRLTLGWHADGSCAAAPRDCFNDAEMNQLVRDPERYLARLASRMVDRMDNVERGLGHRGSHRGVTAAGALYHMGAGEPRRGMEKDPSSVPDTRGTWWRLLSHALPYYVGVGAAGGIETGYRPSYYVGRGTAIVFPVLPVHFSPTRDDRRKQLFVAYGAGVHVRAWGAVDLEGSYQAVRPYAHLMGAPVSTGEGAVIVADKMRVGFRYVLSDPGRFYPTARGLRKDGLSLTIGLVDLNGLVYWTGRLMAH